MFWRQIPRATDVLGQLDLESTSLPTRSPAPAQTSPPVSQRGDVEVKYESRRPSVIDGRQEWKRAIREVQADNRHARAHPDRPLHHISDVVDAVIADNRERQAVKDASRRKGIVRLLRRKSAAKLQQQPDDEPDPITLAKVIPFMLRPDSDGDNNDSTGEHERSSRTAPIERPRSTRRRSASSLASSSSFSAWAPPPNTPRQHSDGEDPMSRSSLPPLPPPPLDLLERQLRNVAVTSAGSTPPNPSHQSSTVDESPPRSPSRSRSPSRPLVRLDNGPPYHRMYGLSGLANLGNSCYLSAVLQCIAATEPLSKFLANGAFRREVNYDNPHGSNGQVATALSVLLRAMMSGRHRVISAARFRDILASSSPQFDNPDQQDAHELLLSLLDALHEDLNLVQSRPLPKPERPDRMAECERFLIVVAADREWSDYRETNDSIVIDFFQGQLCNRLECLTCHRTSTTFQPFQSLTLSIPAIRHGEEDVPLEDCIDTFFDEEALRGDNRWSCPRCRVPRTASKRMIVARLPQILVIHLKRFTHYDIDSTKDTTPVDFPLDDLEMGDLLPPDSTSGRYRLNLAHERRTTYELFALANHLGTEGDSGHYTAVVRKRDTFLEVDDDTITAVSPRSIYARYAKSAYILFYRISGPSEAS
ncbi:hypothetical protein JCM10212_002343 [Sporobolomyces blumeae]